MLSEGTEDRYSEGRPICNIICSARARKKFDSYFSYDDTIVIDGHVSGEGM